MIDRLRKADWEVHAVSLDFAQRLVKQHHYAHGGLNTATYVHGLFRRGDIFDEQCQGIAWWIPPTRVAAHATYPQDWKGVLCLSRLVVLPDVPSNACSFLLARSRKLIDRLRWPCLVTYADEWMGHTGAIYKADNWTYIGKTKPSAVYRIGNRMTARKAGNKTRTHSEITALGCELVCRSAKHKFMRVD